MLFGGDDKDLLEIKEIALLPDFIMCPQRHKSPERKTCCRDIHSSHTEEMDGFVVTDQA